MCVSENVCLMAAGMRELSRQEVFSAYFGWRDAIDVGDKWMEVKPHTHLVLNCDLYLDITFR